LSVRTLGRGLRGVFLLDGTKGKTEELDQKGTS